MLTEQVISLVLIKRQIKSTVSSRLWIILNGFEVFVFIWSISICVFDFRLLLRSLSESCRIITAWLKQISSYVPLFLLLDLAPLLLKLFLLSLSKLLLLLSHLSFHLFFLFPNLSLFLFLLTVSILNLPLELLLVLLLS
jgi:hypothetical protein